MKTIFTFLLLFIIGLKPGFSQVVTAEPDIFTDGDAVTITFHADEGTAALEDYTDDIYAHTGVITNLSTSSGDWKYVIAEWNENTDKAKLTKVAANTYELSISPSIREFYGVPANETIKQLAFVFRNSDGSLEGKGTGGTDIFVDVSEPGIALKVNSPLPNAIFDQNETINISLTATLNDSLKLFIDDVPVAKAKSSTLNFSFDTTVSKVYKIEAMASTDDTTISYGFNIYIKGTIPQSPLPAGARKGIEYTGSNSARLVLFAPYKEMVFLMGDFNGWNLSNDYLMNKDGDYFWIELTGLEAGKEYAFQYYIDGEIYIPDPYANKILDPWNDKSIPEETYPGLISYPAGKTANLVSVLQTDKPEYEWTNQDFVPPPDSNLVIYELLIRDFTEGPQDKEGNIKGVLSKLNYLDALNVNTVELMPFNEFEGNSSWGYNPAMYFATDKAYGTEKDYKMLIDSLHSRGMAVIMDIVLNHSYGLSPMVRMYFEGDGPSAQNPWYNAECPNTVFCWGYDFNHESQYTQEFVDSVLRFWVREFKVDGFRFDFTKGFTNTTGDGSTYDASRIAILKRISDRIREEKEDVILILEHFAPNNEEQELENYGFLLWGNMNYNYNEATMGYHDSNKSDFSRISYQNRVWKHPHLVGYMESHDEERLMYKNMTYGNASGSYNIKDRNTALARQEMAALFFFTVPGPKMVWQFGELGYDYSIDYNGRVNEKPVRWDYLDDVYRSRLYQVYAALIDLKTSEPAFQTTDFNINFAGAVKTIELLHDDMNVVAVGNFGTTAATYDVNMPGSLEWYDYFDHTPVSLQTNTLSVDLEPGEYHLYTTKELSDPDISGNQKFTGKEETVYVFPNPAGGKVSFVMNGMKNREIEVTVTDITGKIVENPFSGYRLSSDSDILEWENTNLSPGVYLIIFRSGHLSKTVRMIRY